MAPVSLLGAPVSLFRAPVSLLGSSPAGLSRVKDVPSYLAFVIASLSPIVYVCSITILFPFAHAQRFEPWRTGNLLHRRRRRQLLRRQRRVQPTPPGRLPRPVRPAQRRPHPRLGEHGHAAPQPARRVTRPPARRQVGDQPH